MKLRSRLLLASILIVTATLGVARAQHAPFYVLDAFGGVHAGGGAPTITPRTPYFGFDVAADIEYIPVGTSAANGDGILVLDKFGGVHEGGALIADPPVGPTPYFGFDAARAIAYRNVPPRLNFTADQAGVNVTNSGFLVMENIPLHTPDHGRVLMIATVEMFCASSSNGDTVMELTMNIDNANAQGVSIWQSKLTAAQCAAGDPATITLANVLPQSAGAHSVFLLARNASGSNAPRLQRRTLTAVYINQNGFGW